MAMPFLGLAYAELKVNFVEGYAVLGFYPNVTLNLFQGLLTDEWLAVCVLKPVFYATPLWF